MTTINEDYEITNGEISIINFNNYSSKYNKSVKRIV